MAGGDGDAEAFASLVIGNDFGQAGRNAQALKLRQDDEPRDALRSFPAERGEDGTEGDGLREFKVRGSKFEVGCFRNLEP